MPRNVSAPITPSARDRPAPGNRCDAADVATGTSAPPPAAWTSRATISSSSVGAAPASIDPTVNSDEGTRNSRRLPHRSARRPARGMVTT